MGPLLADSSAAAQYFCFAIGENQFATAFDHILMVLEPRALIPHPLRGAVLGSVTRGTTRVPVLDLAPALELPVSGAPAGLLVLRTRSPILEEIAIAIDRVDGIAENVRKVQRLPALAASRAACICGIVHVTDSLRLLLEPSRVVPLEEQQDLARWRADG
jgi:chemotaxis signal transduction protein